MKKETITAAAVLCALGAGFLACVLHTDQPLSLSERRPLAQRPEVSVQALASGNYMSEFETYALDQFPLREAMRQLKAQVQYYLLRQKDNNGVYQVDGSLSKIEAVLSESSVRAAAEKLNRFTVWCPIKIIILRKKTDIHIWIMSAWMPSWPKACLIWSVLIYMTA